MTVWRWGRREFGDLGILPQGSLPGRSWQILHTSLTLALSQDQSDGSTGSYPLTPASLLGKGKPSHSSQGGVTSPSGFHSLGEEGRGAGTDS